MTYQIRLTNLGFEIASQDDVFDLLTNRRPQPKNGNQNTIRKSYQKRQDNVQDSYLCLS